MTDSKGEEGEKATRSERCWQAGVGRRAGGRGGGGRQEVSGVGGQVSDGGRAVHVGTEAGLTPTLRAVHGARGDGSGPHPDPAAPQPPRQRRGRGPRAAAAEVPAGGAGGGEGSEGEDQ